MRVTLVISSLYSGGAERVMSIMANYWAKRRDDVTLITIDSLENQFYELDACIQRVALDLRKTSPTFLAAVNNNFIRLKRLREAIKRSEPEVVISFIDRTNVLALVSTRGLSAPVVVSEHIDPRQLPPGGVWNSLRRWTYRWASAVVVLTSELKDVAAEFLPPNKIHVIPNPALPIKSSAQSAAPLEWPSPFLVAMGRLKPQKGFDLLLEAFARCKNKTWPLVILGDGPERERLASLSMSLGLDSRVYFPGRISDPASILSQAGIFVLSSRFEGFPMAILESMSCGLPVISFDCPTGPGDIISDGIDGVLVKNGDIPALAAAMDLLMEDENLRLVMGKRAKDVVDKFSIEKVMGQWDGLLTAVTV